MPNLRIGGAGVGIMAASVLLAIGMGAGTAVAVPPPPPNPSDAELDSSRSTADAKAERVGKLTNQVAEAESELLDLQAEVELKMEEANKALVDLEQAEREARKAKREADAARVAADAAGEDVARARSDLDEFAAGSYKQGSTIGSLSAYVGADSPEDVLTRAELLNAVSDSKLDALDELELARTEQANKDSAAREALRIANEKESQARKAKRDADAAKADAQQARRDQAARAQELEQRKDRAERQLARAQGTVDDLERQRERYQKWRRAKQREQANTQQSAQSGGGGGPRPSAGGGAVQTVINRAMSQLGVVYAWGGGNAYGPTQGIPDGGVADAHGDYNKIGFDCSGLMIYAFAGVGISLPHYSGYQAVAGPRVPLSQKRPGDMLFWASGGRIHHVALYIGNEQMIEAPYSGAYVRITSVRYGGIVPQATRLL